MIFRSLVAALALALPTVAQDAKLTVVHGIPGLPAPVEVFANNALLFSFDYTDVRGPLSIPAGTYAIEVKLNGNVVLSASPTLSAGVSYTAVAHLLPSSGIQLSLFTNDTTLPAAGKARLTVRHLADAPAVDVLARRGRWGSYSTVFANVSNPNEGTVEVDQGWYSVKLNAAGTNTTAFGPTSLGLGAGRLYEVMAIGSLGTPSFQLLPVVTDLRTPPTLVGSVQGTSCGGQVALSTTTPTFGTAFDVTLSGARADTFGFFHAGRSDSRFLFLPLPISLGFLGATGCSLYQSTEMITPIRTSATGTATRSFTIPATAALWFNEIHFQYSYVDGSANSLGLALTDYASVVKQ